MGTVSKLYVSNNTWIYIYIYKKLQKFQLQFQLQLPRVSTPIPNPTPGVATPTPTPTPASLLNINSNSKSNSGSFNSNSNSNSSKSLEYQLELQLQLRRFQLQFQLQLRSWNWSWTQLQLQLRSWPQPWWRHEGFPILKIGLVLKGTLDRNISLVMLRRYRAIRYKLTVKYDKPGFKIISQLAERMPWPQTTCLLVCRGWRIYWSKAGHPNFACDLSRVFLPGVGKVGMSCWVYVTLNYHNLINNDLYYISTYPLLVLCYLSAIHCMKRKHAYQWHGTGIISLQSGFDISLVPRT